MSNKNYRWAHYFIDHPKWAFVLSALFLLLGYQALSNLQLRRFPKTEIGVVTISATYPGASAELMQTRVTQPLQRSVAEAEGIDYLASITQDSFVSIEARLKVGASVDQAFNTILAQVQSANADLPVDMDPPLIKKGGGNNIALLYVAYSFKNSTSEDGTSDIYHYLNTVVRPILSTVPGIGSISILGAQPPAIRMWLDPVSLHHYQINPSEIASALRNQNFSLPAGTFEAGDFRQPLRLNTQLDSIEALKHIPIKSFGDQVIYLEDLAQVELGSTNNDALVLFNDQAGVFLSVDALPTSNATEVIKATRERLHSLEQSLPSQLEQKIVYDATLFIEDSIKEVLKTIIEASLIVVVIVYVFLGSIRAMIIPITAIPLSLFGMIAVMPSLSMSLNLLTLLAMILAIGLVVDDAILVVEHYASTHKKDPAGSAAHIAKQTIDELLSPLIVMTIILALAFSPMVFLKGLTGSLFREFALTLAGSVLLSGVVAICISPVLCAETFKKHSSALVQPQWLTYLSQRYQSTLDAFFIQQSSVQRFVLFLGLSLPLLLIYLPQELAPAEDQGFTLLSYRGPNNSSLDYLKKQSRPLDSILKDYPITNDYFLIHGAGGSTSSGFGGLIAQPWSSRTLSMQKAQQDLQHRFSELSGLEVFNFTPSALPSPDGLPFQWVLYGPVPFEQLYHKSQELIAELRATGYFPFISTDFQFRKMSLSAEVDREKLNTHHQPLSALGENTMLSLSDAPIAQFLYKGESIDCILRLKNRDSEVFKQLGPLFYQDGLAATLSDFSQYSWKTEPSQRPMFNQMPSITIQGALYPTADISLLLEKTNTLGESLKASGYFYDYTGPLRSYLQEQGQLLVTGIMALIIIYLALLALYENWLDPFIILLTVPLALCGALSAMLASTLLPFGVSVTFNIYTQLGLLTLLGLITKHGILLVQVATELRSNHGMGIEEAIKTAANERFRPIIMTTAATVVGVLPLLIASGPGAISRFHLGFVIAFGLSIGTLFTIFLLPVLYSKAHLFFEYRAQEKC